MKKLHFFFADQNCVYYDFKTDYEENGDWIVFDWEDVLYRIKVRDKFEFSRKTKEEEFVLREGGVCEIKIDGIEGNFCVGVVHFEICRDGEKVTVDYELESDKGVTKKIILSLG